MGDVDKTTSINWIMSKNQLSKTMNETIDDEYGVHKDSNLCLIATEHGGYYIGYLELRRSSRHEPWTETWYVSAVQDSGIDCDGVEIQNVIAWVELTQRGH